MSAELRRLYFIRHGRASHRSTDEALTGRGRVADPPLDETGLQQAQALTGRLLKMPAPAAIFVSPLRRALQTIAPYERASGMSAETVEDLTEWFGGAWEFKEFEELLVQHPEMPRRVLMQDPVFFLAPGGETQEALRSRVVAAVESKLTQHPQGDLWFVCHGGVINAYIGMVLGVRDQEMFFLPPNASINTVLVEGPERRVWFLADDTHITQPELFADELHGDAYTPGSPPSTDQERE